MPAPLSNDLRKRIITAKLNGDTEEKIAIEKSAELRERYSGVVSSDFKTLLWNVVYLESDVANKMIEELIHHSVEEVVKKLPKNKRDEYKRLLT